MINAIIKRKIKLIEHLLRHHNDGKGNKLQKTQRKTPKNPFSKKSSNEWVLPYPKQLEKTANNRHEWLQRQGLVFRS